MQGSLRNSCLIALALGVGLAGCGGSSRPRASSTRAATSAPSAPSAPTHAPLTSAHPSKAQAAALAASINLRPADLPGFAAAPHTTTASDRRTDVKLARCSGSTLPGQAVADVHSDDFKSGNGLQVEEVNSEVQVLASPHLVTRDLAAVRSPRARACLTARINALVLRSSGAVHVKLGGVRFTPIPAPAPGADGSFGYRIAITASVRTPSQVIRIPFYFDLLGFGVGTNEVSLIGYRIGQPFQPATEQHLFSLLLSRALGNRV